MPVYSSKIIICVVILVCIFIYALRRFGSLGLLLSFGAAFIGLSIVSSSAVCLFIGISLCLLFFVLHVRSIGCEQVKSEISSITIEQRREEEEDGFIDYSDD